MGSLAEFKRDLKVGFLEGYGVYVCGGCYVCRDDEADGGNWREVNGGPRIVEAEEN